MKIIRPGIDPHNIKVRFTCPSCKCIFECNKGEFSQGFYRNEGYYLAKCPECGLNVYKPSEGV